MTKLQHWDMNNGSLETLMDPWVLSEASDSQEPRIQRSTLQESGALEFGLRSPAVAPVLSALYSAEELAERHLPGAWRYGEEKSGWTSLHCLNS